MGSAPKAPNPARTAAAQTGSNIGTAVANQYMGHVNESTPYGSVNYTYDNQQWTDPSSGKVYDLPVATAKQTYTLAGQRLLDKSMQTQQNLASTARDQSGRINGLLSRPMDMSGVPKMASAPRAQSAMGVGAGPGMITSFNTGGSVKNAAGAQQAQGTFGNAGDVTRSYGTNFGDQREAVERALMNRLQPGLDRDNAALRQQLADQGIQYGSAAYQSAMDDRARAVNDARMSAVLAGGQEQSRMVGLEADRAAFQNAAQGQAYQQALGRAGFANDAMQQNFANNMAVTNQQNAAQAQRFDQNQTAAAFNNTARQQQYQNAIARAGVNNAARQQEFQQQSAAAAAQNANRSQALQETYARRSQPLNEIAALMSGSQVQAPSFLNTQGAQMAGTDYAGIVNQGYANQMAQYQQQQGLMGSLFGAGANLLMLSDRRTKTDIKRVGKLDDGQPVYRYRYKAGGPMQIGLMAQDVKKRAPEAVKTLQGGIMAVDYGKATEGATR